MENRKVQSIFRYASYICLTFVIIGQFFKEQTLFLQKFLPYFTLAALIFLLASIYLIAKFGEFKQQNLRIKFVLIFVFVVISVLILIYQLTKK